MAARSSQSTPQMSMALAVQEERETLLAGGFREWTRRDFNAFTRACEKVCSLVSWLLLQVKSESLSYDTASVSCSGGTQLDRRL